jgi:DNA-directed RNA polymerase subunit RPC12/RpoP
MSNANTFNCPTCDAPLPITGAELEVKCPYCGNVVVVPQSLRGTSPSQGPQIYQSGQITPEAQAILEEVAHKFDSLSGQPIQQYQTFQPLASSTPRTRRRSGCGCFGCLSFIAVLLIMVLIALGVFVAIAPGQINQVLTQVNNAVQPAIADIGIFSVDPSVAKNNSVVTFRWAVNNTGNTVTRLDRTINGSTLTLLPSLPSVGSSTYQVTGKPGDKITFKLISTRNGVSTEKSVVVTIK